MQGGAGQGVHMPKPPKDLAATTQAAVQNNASLIPLILRLRLTDSAMGDRSRVCISVPVHRPARRQTLPLMVSLMLYKNLGC